MAQSVLFSASGAPRRAGSWARRGPAGPFAPVRSSAPVWAAVAALTGLAALLRLPFLSHGSFWVDEVYTRWVVQQPGLSAMWQQIHRTESTPPLFYLLAALSREVWGNAGPFALRLPAALSLVAAVPVAFLAFRRLLGEMAACGAAAFVAVDPTLVAYATDARAYGLLVLTGLVTVWALVALLDDPGRRRFAVWGLACAAALWTHYFAIFTVLGEAAVIVVVLPWRRGRLLVTLVAVAIVCVPVGVLAVAQSHNGMNAFITAMPWPQRLADALRQYAMGANVPGVGLEIAGLAVVSGALLVGMARARDEPGLAVLLALLAATIGLPLLCAVVGIEDRFYMRNTMLAIPLLGALCGPALGRARGRWLALAGAVLVLLGGTAAWVAEDWRYGQPDWRAAVAALGASERAGAVLVSEPGAFPGPTAGVYLGRARAYGPVRVETLTLIVGPTRPAHSRALEPVATAASVTAGLGGWRTAGTYTVQGFRIVRLVASEPRTLTPGALGAAVLFAPARSG